MKETYTVVFTLILANVFPVTKHEILRMSLHRKNDTNQKYSNKKEQPLNNDTYKILTCKLVPHGYI